ncbi:Peptidoglycan/xylan/chitin deacetylase, PgdA/CDA1 family [Thermosyntropha lipolytica DSM 11003]|uniref:Peptidoglycan/xylan/chitin deacetylase, PgdA/CDA1 family n=1 Tax=Thermosyntropha lipolytica DSM 11003 TaxID=1123382 RepID=A0A1M5K576_9FIRM|nr:polysaccharide deacetylase family protein [Thermosyntropha lipolytica]SHG47393.1 Peptidoglycan/xylan/chitin deacetylase, PgdA/CDA1 family [Thermosyntropha lipolytica DSM 11003]
MLIYIKKKPALLLLSCLFILGFSIGAYRLTLHPNMENWKQKKIIITEAITDQKILALTFDDGPHPANTPLVLDLLQKHQSQATFFVLGQYAEKYPEIIKRMAKEGHEIGNHSFSHPDFNRESRFSIQEEIKKTNQIVYNLTGTKPRFFRPPGGYLSYEMVDLVVEEKMIIGYWSYIQDPKDWQGKKAEDIAHYIIKHARPGQIIILHDGGPNGKETALSLDIFIPELKQQGYRFVTLTQLVNAEKSNKNL